MSGQDVNPFVNQTEVNPFAPVAAAPPPAVNTTPANQGLSEYNPFAQQQSQQTQNAYPSNPYSATPATIEPSRAEPAYQNKQYGMPDDSMRSRQEELERKAAELEKREIELNQAQNQGLAKQNNFPPLPAFCCVKPCFYHDISVDIPMEGQKTCKMMFVIWQFYVFCLFFNLITALAALCIGYESGGTLFGVGILYFVIFTPCSFVMWYRPIYKALRSGSSFNYMLFFFIFFCQAVFAVIYGLGINVLGTCGWINGAGIATSKIKGKEAVSAMFFISGALFSLLAIFMAFLLRKVHSSYRRSGASLEKAQSEFAKGIATNKNVQNAAVEAVKASASSSNTRY